METTERFFNGTATRINAPHLYDSNGVPLQPGDRIKLAYSADEDITARLCIEEVYVLRYDQPTEETGAVSRMIRHSPQAELVEYGAVKV